MDFMKFSFLLAMLACFLIYFSISQDAKAAQTDDDLVRVHFLSVSGAALDELAIGEVGEGYLLYYLPERGIEKPSLVVHLQKEEGAKVAIAKVYDANLTNRNYVSIKGVDDPEQFQLNKELTPRITIEALDGWWVRDGMVNYNLDIQTNGAMYAMWGAGYDPKRGEKGWASEQSIRIGIQVRDPNQTGFPQWDLRSLEQVFGRRGYYYSNYAERKCDTATEIDLGLSPLWPFVSKKGGFEQSVGQHRPPIVVDWETAQITHFSELVTVRNQNCSYSLYSINPLKPGELNQANFESPFAFYDLSGEGQGYPNLLLRTERFPKNDPWSMGIEPKVQRGRRAPRDIEWIRYSWRNEVGDGFWDYKIEVLGFHPYTDETIIADGWASIDAPAYEAFPNWVIEKEWPVVTFIDTEGTPYRSNEGIYDWSPREVGIGYVFGWEDKSKPQAFETIGEGLRGEYRHQTSLQPKLYLSPIDQRLHLLGAEGGLWNLGKGEVIRLHNLDRDLYLDGWTREYLPDMDEPSVLTEKGTVKEALYSFEGHLLYSSEDEVVIREVAYDPSIFEFLPPSDKATWQAFRKRLDSFLGERVGPTTLKSWFDHFPEEATTITNAQLSEVRHDSTGFGFILDLEDDYEVQGNRLFDLNRLEVGQYEVSYDGQWHISPIRFSPLSIKVELSEPKKETDEPFLTKVQINYRGTREVKGLTFMADASLIGAQTGVDQTRFELTRQPLDVLDDTQLMLNWQPDRAGSWRLRFRLLDKKRNVVAETWRTITIPEDVGQQATVLALSTNNGSQLLSYLSLLGFSLLMGLLWQRQEVSS